MSIIDRRTILAAPGALVAGLAAAQVSAFAAPAVGIDQLDYRDVELLDGPALAQRTQTLATLSRYPEDELLRPFREAAGLPVGAAKFGGWYDASPDFDPPRDMHGFIPGHSFGQYVSSLARGYAVTGDPALRNQVDRLLAGFAPTITPAFFRGYPLPAYTYDKIVMGLIDAHQFAGNRQAFGLLDRVTDAVLPALPGRALDRMVVEKQAHPDPAFGWDETYTLPENLYLAAERGAGARYRTMARAYLLDDAFFRPLAAGRNVLPGRHAYSHVNALASAMKAYLVDGDRMHLAAARNGLGMVVDQSFATGGWGPNEAFVVPGSGDLGRSLSATHASFETPCGTYGHFKVARYLMRVTGDSRWGDSMERLLYNASLGALALRRDGGAFYYADYNDLGTKTYHESNCPCCSGSIGQLAADYGISAYLQDRRGLYVNLYIPSRANWRGADGVVVALNQRGSYPLGDDIAFDVAASRPTAMALRLRIPAWAGADTRLAVNGRPWAGTLNPGSFARIERKWRTGDQMTLSIARPLRLEAVDAQHPDRVALVQGPLALFATGDRIVPLRREEMMMLRQQKAGDTDWSLTTDAGTLAFKPFFAIGRGEPTRLYQFLA